MAPAYQTKANFLAAIGGVKKPAPKAAKSLARARAAMNMAALSKLMALARAANNAHKRNMRNQGPLAPFTTAPLIVQVKRSPPRKLSPRKSPTAPATGLMARAYSTLTAPARRAARHRMSVAVEVRRELMKEMIRKGTFNKPRPKTSANVRKAAAILRKL